MPICSDRGGIAVFVDVGGIMDFGTMLSELDARNVNSLVLAYVGDAVQSLIVRTQLATSSDAKAGDLHVATSRTVNAHAQAVLADSIYDSLTEREQDVYHRARNTKNSHNAKNQSRDDYKKATALEAVIGYLYLMGDIDRIRHLLEAR